MYNNFLGKVGGFLGMRPKIILNQYIMYFKYIL